jgi:predicted molibdopterin-dependent oxidoreductase YjgC
MTAAEPLLAEQVTLIVNGTPLAVPRGTTVAVAVALQGVACRRSVSGERRAPLCGIGICFECRVEIDGRPHCRSCQILCAAGMKVRTDE